MLIGLANIYKTLGLKSLGEALVVKFPICVHVENNLKLCYISGFLEALYRSLMLEKDISEILSTGNLGRIPRTRDEYYEVFENTFKRLRDADLRITIGSTPALLFFA